MITDEYIKNIDKIEPLWNRIVLNVLINHIFFILI